MFYVLGKYLYLFLDITSKLSVFPDFPYITKFVNPARFSLFFINCLAGILPLNCIIFSSMLLFFSGGSSLQCLLTALVLASIIGHYFLVLGYIDWQREGLSETWRYGSGWFCQELILLCYYFPNTCLSMEISSFPS